MFSTIALAKNSKFSGQIVGTHQRLDQAARRSLAPLLSRGQYFPSSKEIIHFEGSRGPDGLKRKSPGLDEPSHMLVLDKTGEILQSSTDSRTVPEMINDHYRNLIQALKSGDHIRAAFDAAWLAHMITDGLTPAHHFPLPEVQDELMTDKEMVKFFGAPIKGIMHGRNLPETLRNNWLYWGAGGHMSKHIAYEYGVLMITTTLPPQTFEVTFTEQDLQDIHLEETFMQALKKIYSLGMYDRFLENGWTTELAYETKTILLPEIVRIITLSWYAAAADAYGVKAPRIRPRKSSSGVLHHE